MRDRPYIVNNNGVDELVIPVTCDDKYKFWAGGQSLQATLKELGASVEMMRRHCGDVAANEWEKERPC